VFGEELAKMLGYRSTKALYACQEANDHHKAFQFVEILLFGTGIINIKDQSLHDSQKYFCFEINTMMNLCVLKETNYLLHMSATASPRRSPLQPLAISNGAAQSRIPTTG
jgi:hypothetical protein